MFRRCCGKRDAKKSAKQQAAAAAAAAADDEASTKNASDSQPQRPESAMRDNDFRNIDNNSVLVEFQENVRVSQSTETIPVAVAAYGLILAEKPSMVHEQQTGATNGRGG